MTASTVDNTAKLTTPPPAIDQAHNSAAICMLQLSAAVAMGKREEVR